MAAEPSLNTVSTFGTVLRTYRLAAGLTQEDLAERAGLSLRGVSDLERGVRQFPRLETVRMLAHALGCEPDTPPWTALLAARNAANPATVTTAPSRLPLAPAPLIGRDQDVSRLVQALCDSQTRLLTLVGPGGVGKTRLAIAAATQLADHFPAGVVFADLTPIRDPALVLPTIAAALGLRVMGSGHLVEEIASRIGTRRLLLLIDNVEQVVAAAPDIAALLGACPHLSVLATSRVVLHIAAERIHRLEPLEVPHELPLPALENLERLPAVALFVARARAFDPGFALTVDNAEAVAALVHLLEGLPLAIELAAAWVRALPPRTLLDRLDRRASLLTGGPRDAPARQRTMRDTIAWSYDLLPADEQRLWRNLAVFIGGFSLEAAESVTAHRTTSDVVAGLAGLMDASLLHRYTEVTGTSRYRMLEMVREFGLEQLAQHGEESEARDAHAAHFLRQASSWREQMQETATDASRQAGYAQIEEDRDNLRAALAWIKEHHRIEDALAVALATWPYRTNHGHDVEAHATIGMLLSRQDAAADSPLRAQALLALCHFARRQGHIDETLRSGQEALQIFRRNGDTLNAGRAGASLGWALMDVNRHGEAIEHYRSALDLAQLSGDIDGTAAAHDLLGWLHLNRNEFEDASAHLQEALRISRESGSRLRIANVYGHLAIFAGRHGDRPLATRRFEEAIAIARELGDYHLLASALVLLADLIRRDGDLVSAEAIILEAYDISERTGYTHGLAFALFAQGRLAAERGRLDEAIGFLQRSIVAFERIGLGYGMQYSAVHVLNALACLALQLRATNHAARFLGMADALLERSNLPRVQGDVEYRDLQGMKAVRQALVDPGFARQWHDGKALGEHDVVREVLAFSLIEENPR